MGTLEWCGLTRRMEPTRPAASQRSWRLILGLSDSLERRSFGAHMPQSSSLIPTMTALAAPAAAVVILTALRPRLPPDVRGSQRLLFVVGLTISAQVLHFVEELLTSFRCCSSWMKAGCG